MSFWPTSTGEWIALVVVAILSALPWAVLIQTLYDEWAYHADMKPPRKRRRR